MSNVQKTIQSLLDETGSGIVINGPNPWDPQVRDDEFYSRLLSGGSIGLGEAYMDGLWTCQALDQLFERVVRHNVQEAVKSFPQIALKAGVFALGAKFINRQTIERARYVGKMHYDERMLHESTYDQRLTGSCAYWVDAADVDEAQERKLDLVCRKIELKPGQTVLDIGCGWGAFMGFAAEHYGARCIGVTISQDQVAYATERYRPYVDSGHLEFRFQDYREFKGTVDHVVSMGMFEHVGSDNYRDYFAAARRAMRGRHSRFMHHTITGRKRSKTIDPWLDKYIFPRGELPTIGQIMTAVEGLFVVEDVQNIGPHYDLTLMAWNDNFQSRREEVVAKYGERVARMWEYYLLQCAGGFRSNGIGVAQTVLSPDGVDGGYISAR
ncbi:MAG TPA: cyclopropane fatty acyl phospholipid synthase [Candidatus Paceibacterota bacterium]|nr:cyclopropane fatty acyl phospholipid synthase [Candidatus Paceibacterota bacterium]